MHEINIHEIDLNLLVAFNALMRERNVTRAGERIGLTQPAMSHALTRLRRICGDPLFVRVRRGMEPTEFAQQLGASVAEGLQVIEAGLEGKMRFEPATAQQDFQIVMSDMGELVYLPPLMLALKARAPGVNIRVLQISRDRYQDAFETGAVDLGIGVWPNLQESFYQQRLFSDSYACLVRGDHPRIGTTLTLKQFADESHVMIEPVGSRYSHIAPAPTGTTLVERVLSEHGLTRRVALRVPHFIVVPTIVQTTDFIATLPRTVVSMSDAPRNLKLLPLPFQAPNFVVRQFWHQRSHHDPANRWLRNLVAELFLQPS